MRKQQFILWFRRNKWIVHLMVIAAGGYVVAAIANGVVTGSSDDEWPLFSIEDRTSFFGDIDEGPATLDAIVERNLMAARRDGGGDPDLVARPPGELACRGVSPELKPCSLPGRVIGTVVGDGPDGWSFAMVDVRGTSKMVAPIPGHSTIDATSRVCAIRRDSVLIARHDRMELCRVSANARSASVEKPVRITGLRFEPSGVRYMGKGQYEVDRVLINDVQRDLAPHLASARFVASRRGGDIEGFRALSIKPGSLLANLGLRNGDIVTGINGYLFEGVDDLLDLYQKLGETETATVQVRRRGRSTTLVYDIVD